MPRVVDEIEPKVGQMPAVKICILYADSDKDSLEQLVKQLDLYRQAGQVSIWHRGHILPGRNRQAETSANMDLAQVVALLISADFFAERRDELRVALAAAQRGAVLIPILCRPTVLDQSPLVELNFLPSTLAVSQWRDRDVAWTLVAQGIVDILNSPPIASKCPATPRSSANLADVVALRNAPRPDGQSRIKVLFLGANPVDGQEIDLGREIKQIAEGLDAFSSRDSFLLAQEWAVNAVQLSRLLLKHRPTILHFSGHGSRMGQIVLEDGNGRGQPVPIDALANLFAVLNKGNDIACVVFSSCFSEPQARAIAEHVPCVVGISGTVSDGTAAAFAAGFYSALAAGQSFEIAFELGRVQIALLAKKPTQLCLFLKPGLADLQKRLLPQGGVS